MCAPSCLFLESRCIFIWLELQVHKYSLTAGFGRCEQQIFVYYLFSEASLCFRCVVDSVADPGYSEGVQTSRLGMPTCYLSNPPQKKLHENENSRLVGMVPGTPLGSTNGLGHCHCHPEYCHLFLCVLTHNYYKCIGLLGFTSMITQFVFSRSYRSYNLQFCG